MTASHPAPRLPEPVVLRPARPGDAAALRRLWQLFRHDMSAVNHTLPDVDGLFRSERLEAALAGEPGWEAWIGRADGHPVALAVARALDRPEHVLSSFFVATPARRGGLGLRLATSVLAAHPGRWAIAFQDDNGPAARFWPRVAAALDPEWRHEHRAVPGRPDLPPDHWVRLNVAQSRWADAPVPRPD